jgi:hypothetical protein
LSTDLVLRLTTDASITAVLEETPFSKDTLTLIRIRRDRAGSRRGSGRRFFEETGNYWRHGALGIPRVAGRDPGGYHVEAQ